MDNPFSQAQLQLPTVPADFDSRCGSSRRDMAIALFELLRSAQITGVTVESPSNFDLTSLQRSVESLSAQVSQNSLPRQRVVNMAGATNNEIIVPFDDIGTTNYWVNVIVVSAAPGDINTVTWALIESSRQTNQCQIRIDGTGAGYQLMIIITEIKG